MVEVDRGCVEDLLGTGTTAHQVFDALAALVDELGPATVRVTKSQLAFRRRSGFCWIWLPGMYLARPAAEVVVSVALPRQDLSPRWKESVKVGGRRWMHHLEVQDPGDLDDEVTGWLAGAYDTAG